MGCVSGQPKNNELKAKNDLNNGNTTSHENPPPLVQNQHPAPPPEQPQEQLNHKPPSHIHQSAGKNNSGINLPSNINHEVPSNLAQIQNRPITVNDINVSGLNHIADKPPVSNIVEIQSHDYAPSGIVKKSGLNGIQIQEQVNTSDEDVVHSEGAANFTPSVRNINFHIQIS